MATTRIMPLHIGKGRSVGTAVSDILEYVKDAEKTDQGRLVTCFQCNPEIADAEFCFSKRRYQTSTGRKQENDVIANHVRQSFKPGEITPEEANRLGCEFAERFLKGTMCLTELCGSALVHGREILTLLVEIYWRVLQKWW